MRWIAFAVAALAAMGTDAAEPAAAQLAAVAATALPVAGAAAIAPLPDPTPIPGPEPVVTVTVMPQDAATEAVATVDLIAAPNVSTEVAATPPAVAGPLAAIALSPPAKHYSEIRPGKRLAPRKARRLNTALLSRTARHQMALLAATAGTDDPIRAALGNHEDAGTGIDAIDLQVFYQRPKVVTVDEPEGDPEISDPVKLRLFIARMKAVAAHRTAHMADRSDDVGGELSETIKLRLFLARMKAVEAHRRKFS